MGVYPFSSSCSQMCLRRSKSAYAKTSPVGKGSAAGWTGVLPRIYEVWRSPASFCSCFPSPTHLSLPLSTAQCRDCVKGQIRTHTDLHACIKCPMMGFPTTANTEFFLVDCNIPGFYILPLSHSMETLWWSFKLNLLVSTTPFVRVNPHLGIDPSHRHGGAQYLQSST